MGYLRLILVGSVASVLSISTAIAQEDAEQEEMTFFVTSVGSGDGANLGGIDGADAHCQSLAAAAGAGGKTWHAYLSTQGQGAVNARDRIGSGPWFNHGGRQIAANLSDLHGDTLEEARNGNLIGKMTALSENGDELNGVGQRPLVHDIITGTQQTGMAYTDSERSHLFKLDQQRRRHRHGRTS